MSGRCLCSTLNAMDTVRAIFFSLALSITGYFFSLPSPSRSTLLSRACIHKVRTIINYDYEFPIIIISCNHNTHNSVCMMHPEGLIMGGYCLELKTMKTTRHKTVCHMRRLE